MPALRLYPIEPAREVTARTPAAATGPSGGGATRLRTRAGTHRRKCPAGAGVESGFRGGDRRGGKCRSGRGGGGRGGDGDGPGEGEMLRLAEALPRLRSPFRVTYRPWGTRAFGAFPVFGTQISSPPENLDTVHLPHSAKEH